MEFLCKALLFDLDGVLIDSSRVIHRHWQQWADQHQIPFDRVLAVIHGRPSAEIIRRVAPHLDAEAEGRRREALEGIDTDGLQVFDGAGPLLEALPPGLWGVVTSGNRLTAATRLGYGGFPTPAVLVTIDDVSRGKPNPAPYLLAAERLGVNPADCLVIEDSPAGLTAALDAGMRTLAVATTTDPQDLTHADAIVRSLAGVQVQVEGAQLRITCQPVFPTGPP